VFLESDETGVERIFSRTSQRIEVEWGPTIKFAMGGATDLVTGAVLRVFGKLSPNNIVQGEMLIVLTRVAKFS
jgi:hypothetical protein